MSVSLVSTPEKTINGVLSNVTAGRSQAPFEFLATLFDDKENYKINIDVLDENDVPFFDVTFKYSPRPDGTLFVDLGQIVTEVNERRGSLSVRFKVQYFETYTGFEGAKTIIGEYLAVYAKKQNLSRGGANMWDYVLSNTDAFILTVFECPVYWSGFARLYSVLMDSNFFARTGLAEVAVTYTQLDINKNPVSEADGSETSDFTPRTIITELLQGSETYTQAQVKGLSRPLIYERRNRCENPIMVDWLNSKGGVDQWLFEMDQIYERDAHEGLKYTVAISENIENVRRTVSRSSDNWTQQIILKAENLQLDQLKALEEIKSSISVRVWLNANGSEWVGVIASAKYKTLHNSSDKKHEFTLQLELPEDFDLNNAIDYSGIFIDELIDSDNELLIDLDNEILIG